MKEILAKYSLSITDARTELSRTINAAGDHPVALMQNNNIIAYIVPPQTFEKMSNESNNSSLSNTNEKTFKK